jgi:hypothetical protein
VIRALRLNDDAIGAVAAREWCTLRERELSYRGKRSRPPVEGHTVILVDDGLATRATMRAAVRALTGYPRRLVAAVPADDEVRELLGRTIVRERPQCELPAPQLIRQFQAMSGSAATAEDKVGRGHARWAGVRSDSGSGLSREQSTLTLRERAAAAVTPTTRLSGAE